MKPYAVGVLKLVMGFMAWLYLNKLAGWINHPKNDDARLAFFSPENLNLLEE